MSLRDIAAALPLASLMGLRAGPAPRAHENAESDGPAPASRFAHLAGLPAATKAAPEPEQEPDPEDPNEEEEQDTGEGVPMDPPVEAAPYSEDETVAEEDPEDEMAGESVAAQSRRRERARCAAIFADAAAARAPALAAHLAFETALPRAAALATLQAGLAALNATTPVATPARAALAARMQSAPAPQVGDEAPANGGPASPADAAKQSAAAGLDRLRSLGMRV